MPLKRKRPSKQNATTEAPKQDVILPMREPYMTQILEETKRYEFRKYRMADTVKRAWFYRVTPISAITHVGEIAPPVTRRELLERENLENGDETPEVTHVEEQAEVDEQIRQEEDHRKRRKVEDGDHAQDQLLRATGDSVTVREDKSENKRLVLDIPAWKWGQYAYGILTVYELETPITLHKLKEKYGFAGPPRGMVYLPDMIKQDVDWENQKKVGSLWAQMTWN